MIDYTKAYSSDTRKSFDEGLRAYMIRIYNFMTLGLLLTAATAFLTLNFEPLTRMIYEVTPNGAIVGFSGLGTIMTFVPLGIAIFFFMGIGRISVQTAQTLFWVYAAVMGVSLSSLGLAYTGTSLVRVFFITASVFGAVSLYGYTTKKDLTSMGSFLIMGLFGLIIASVVNIFLQSSAVEFALSFLGVIIFVGLTAYDTQKLKVMYYSSGGGEAAQRVSIVGAFTLYLDFINLFLYLLRFLGDRR